MRNAIAFLLALAMAGGCAAPQEATTSDVRLEVVKMLPLPALKPFMTARLKVNVLIHVLQDGTVENVKMLGSSGDVEWDAHAIQSIKGWLFSPPRRDGVKTDIWARQVLVVQVEEPIVMTLGRVSANRLDEADSLYALLRQGTSLDSSFKKTLETLDILTYPKRIRDVLKHLDVNDFSRPVRLGETYVIFKRFPDAVEVKLPG